MRQRPLRPGEPAGTVVRRGAGAAGAGGQPGEQLGVHGDDGAGVGPEGVVGAAAAGGAGAVAGAAPGAEALGAAPGVQDVCERLRTDPLSDRAGGAAAGVSAAVLESAPADLLPLARPAALLSQATLKSASGCADPRWHPTRSRRMEKAHDKAHNATRN